MKAFEFARRRFGRLSSRSKAVGLFFVTSVSARATGIVCQLLQLPVAVHALGTEAFGLWMTLSGLGTMIMFADFGLGQGAQNRLAEAFAAGDDRRARALFGGVAAVLAGLGVLLAAAVLAAAPALDPAALFRLADPAVRAQAPAAVTCTLLLFCLNFPFGIAQRLANARQRGWTHNIAQAAGGAGSLGGVLFAAQARLDLAGFIAAAQIPVILANAGLLVFQLARLGWLDVRTLRPGRAALRGVFGLGACFGVQQLQLVLLLSLPQVIISASLGAAAVTPYNLAQRLFNLFAVVQNALMLPLWPAYTDARARGDFDWIRRTLFRSLCATVLCVILPMAFGTLFARPILAHWVGGSAELPAQRLLWLLFLWNALVFLQQAVGYLLAGVSQVRRLTLHAAVSTAACPGLMVALAGPYGREGVVLGMIAGFMPFFLFGNVAETVRFFRRHYGPSKPAALFAEIPSPRAEAPFSP